MLCLWVVLGVFAINVNKSNDFSFAIFLGIKHLFKLPTKSYSSNRHTYIDSDTDAASRMQAGREKRQ